ncbi:MAG TPA: ELWxxDGT repeat protein, partial [Flavisolibacter sp.]|nr:ELWxxDGT repeat protein [Flavisolibacter sp.]
WKSDGTAAGTVRIKDIYAAGTSSAPSFITPLDLSGTPGIVFFANNNTNGREPWVSDGTEAGTVMIRNIASENPSSDVKNYAFSNGIIYFSASTLNEGAELWKSDGTTAGTVLLKDLLPGASDGNPQYLTNYSGYIYFTSGGNLWRTDGTTAGTIVVKPGIGPAHLAVHNGLLYFSAAEGTSGAELWRSDGTTAGTYMLKEIRPGGTVSTRSSSPQNFNSLGNTLVFTAIDATGLRQLWKTDGTEAGTVKIVPSATISFISTEFARAGGLLYFTATSGDTGLELWRTDGTDAGTFMPKNIFPETTPGLERDAAPKYLTAFGNMVLFSAESQFGDGSPGRELWRSDGTSAGTVMVKNINPVPYAVSPAVEGGSHPSDIMVAGGIAYFYAFHPDFGRELWKTDGTDAGTVPVLDASPGIQSGIPGDFISGNNDFRPAVVNGSIYYPSGNSTTGIELYRADNSNASIVSEMIAGTGGSSPSRLFRADDVLYFYNDEGINGRELWRYAPPANYSLPAGSAEVTININEENTADTLDQLLATITQKGAQPLNHAVLVKVTKDPSVQSYNGQAYVQRHYDIEPVFNSALATAGLTLYFTQQEFDAYNIVPGTADLPSYPGDAAGKANLRIIQYHGVGTAPGNYPGTQETIDPDDNNIVWNSDAARWEVSFNVTGFSGFYITSIGSVLPVTLLSFTGRIDNGIARLEWKVAEEQDIEHYIVEKSADGISFAAFDTVAAVNAGDHTYMLYDSRPFEGNNFYRLRIKEQDGSTRFSQAVRLVKDSRDAVRIYPQPASDKLMIHTGSNRLLNTAAQLSDGSGRLISRFVLNAQPYMLDISRLATGIYYIGLGNGETVRFQKQ